MRHVALQREAVAGAQVALLHELTLFELQALMAAATQAQTLSQARYDAGLDSFVTLLDARRTAYTARKSLVSTQLAQQSNQVALYKVLGGGWHERG